MKHLSRLAASLLAFALLAAVLTVPRSALAYGTETRSVANDTEFFNAMADANVGTIHLTGSVSYNGNVDKVVNLGGNTLTLPRGAWIGGTISNGTIDCELLYNGGTLTSCSVSGSVYSCSALDADSVSSFSALILSGGGRLALSSDVLPAFGGVWLPFGSSVSGAISNNGYHYSYTGTKFTPEVYTIRYIYNDGKNTPMTSLDQKTYPTSYTVSESPLTIQAAPSQTGYAFEYWTAAGLSAGNSITIPAGKTGDITLYSNWKMSASAGTGGAGASVGAGGKSGVSAAAVAAEDITASEDGADETAAAAATAATATTGRGARISVASSSVKTNIDGSAAAVVMPTLNDYAPEEEANAFPWTLAGAIALLAAGVVGAALILKRRNDARTAAMLNKLNIRE